MLGGLCPLSPQKGFKMAKKEEAKELKDEKIVETPETEAPEEKAP